MLRFSNLHIQNSLCLAHVESRTTLKHFFSIIMYSTRIEEREKNVSEYNNIGDR